MINSVVELHDSEVAAVAEVGSQVVVFFSHAYVHKSAGRPGLDAGTGWSQAAALGFSEGSLEGDLPCLPAGIGTGALVLDGQLMTNEIPVPFQHAGQVVLRLHLDRSAEITVSGRSAALILIGEPAYVEEFRSGREA